MFTWKKLGCVFNPAEIKGYDWMTEFAQGPSVLIFEKFVRVYFSCRPKPDSNGKYTSFSAYVDFSRNDLTKVINISKQPILELGATGTFDEFGTYPVSVIRDKEGILAYYGGWTRCESVPFNVAIGVARSYDEGETFKKMGAGPVIPYSLNEPFILSGPKIRQFNNKWYLFYIAGRKWLANNGSPEPVYKIRMATSEDGLKWNKFDRDLIADKLEINEAQASPDVFYFDNKYHMFFCYRYGLDYRNKERGYRIGYASSLDLEQWTRDDTRAGIDVSDSGWDSEMVSYPHVFELDGNLYMYYLGNQVGKYGFGLAKLDTYS